MTEERPTDGDAPEAVLARRLRHPDGSIRLQAALAAGSSPAASALGPLIERCAVEPDFFVRDMLTWALTRQSADRAVPRLLDELASPFPQARSQALHTLSKIRDARTWPALTAALLHDEEDEVARAAWRAAVLLVPAGGAAALAADLAGELGRRSRECRRSLTRALLDLGEAARTPLEQTAAEGAFAVRVHALATLHLLDRPERGFDDALADAERDSLATPGAAEERRGGR